LDGKHDNNTQQLTTGTLTISFPSISPDGKKIAFSKGIPNTEANISTIPLEGDQEQRLTFLKSNNVNPVWSPDGQQIAFGSNQDGQNRVWIIDIDKSSQMHLTKGRYWPLTWSNDAEWIYVVNPGHSAISRISIHEGVPKNVAKLPVDNVGGVSMIPDGKQIVYTVREYQSDIWVMENFDPDQETKLLFRAI